MTRAGGVVWMLTEVREMLTAEGTVYSMERAMWAMGAHGVSDGVRGVHMGAKICVSICQATCECPSQGLFRAGI